MSHFAKVESGIVTEVIVAEQEYINTLRGTWIQTSYNSNIRKNFAGVGHIYDSEKDVFYAQKPYPSWILNNTTCKWEAPSKQPSDGKVYEWDEDTTKWKEI